MKTMETNSTVVSHSHRQRRRTRRRKNLSETLSISDKRTILVLFYTYLAIVVVGIEISEVVGGVLCETVPADDGGGGGVELEHERQDHDDHRQVVIPEHFDAPFGSYPNLLDFITPQMRESFAIVVRQIDPVVNDNRDTQSLASSEEIREVKRRPFVWKLLRRMMMRRFILPLRSVFVNNNSSSSKHLYDIGKYDENRISMYSSEHFQDVDNEIDGFGGQRTVHLGIDLGAPVGTPVRAFERGIVHSVGYNPEHGDYGYVIVVEHTLLGRDDSSSIETKNATTTESVPEETRKVWALYGHLDRSVLKFLVDSPVRKGEIIGRIGDVDENGGWMAPHVHFQLSVQPPKQPHDMPGASSVKDRPTALLVYPDPRYVLGEIY